VSGEHLQADLDEFIFRFNRRRTPMAAFQTLLGLGSAQQVATYADIYAVRAHARSRMDPSMLQPPRISRAKRIITLVVSAPR
jgi:hypothetical protein